MLHYSVLCVANLCQNANTMKLTKLVKWSENRDATDYEIYDSFEAHPLIRLMNSDLSFIVSCES